MLCNKIGSGELFLKKSSQGNFSYQQLKDFGRALQVGLIAARSLLDLPICQTSTVGEQRASRE